MKKLFSLFAVFALLFVLMFAATQAFAVSKSMTFKWQQDDADLPVLKEWKLYSSLVEGGPFTVVGTFTFNGTKEPEYTGSTNITFPDNANTKMWFRLTAVSTSNLESTPSNTIFYIYNGKPLSPPVLLQILLGAQ